MIAQQTQVEVLRLYHVEKWKVGTIAAQLKIHHSTVQRVLLNAGVPADKLSLRSRLVDPYVPFIVDTLTKYPNLCASRLYQMVKARGYPGAEPHFRWVVTRYRPRKVAEAYLRLRTLPAEQAQCDWGYFGKIAIGAAIRVLWAFVMVLSYSRAVFLRFFLSAAMPSFLRGHVEAFEYFGGVPKIVLYDNLKSAVLERVGDAIRFNPALLALTGHYHFEPRPVSVARGNEKGRVERAIRYVRDNFFAARTFQSLEDLNAQALAWMTGPCAERPWPEQPSERVLDALERERPKLLALAPNPFPCEERVEVHIGKTPYARFDLNDYSVPADYVQKTLCVVASPDTVRILDGTRVIAVHQRCWDRGRQIEDDSHIRDLVERKQLAKQARGLDRLSAAAPSSKELLELAATRGDNLGNIVSRLLHLLDYVSAVDLEEAIAEAVQKQTPHVGAVRHILDRNFAQRGLPPPVYSRFISNPRARDIVVRPHSLDTYDQLREACNDKNSR